MTTHTFDYALFQQQIPAYASAPGQAIVSNWWTIGTNYVSPNDTCSMNGATVDLALNLMAAHLIYLNDLIASGQTPSIVNASSIDKISVTLEPPPVKGMFQFWLATSPYGQQLLALLKAASGGGWYSAVGIPERRGFRKAYGTWR